jgi:hypothetical protein
MKIPTEWTTAERIDMATTLLRCMQIPLISDRHAQLDLPTTQMVLDILHLDPLKLNALRDSLTRMLRAWDISCD